MKKIIALSALAAAVAACSDDNTKPPPEPGDYSSPKPPRAEVTHPAETPFAAVTGDFAFVSNTLGIGATANGVLPIAVQGARGGTPPAGFSEWALTSTGSGAAIAGIAVAPENAFADGRYAFFLPTAQAQAGALVAARGNVQGELLSESALPIPLASMFPSAIEAPTSGAASSALWIADAIFGPGSVVRAYDYASWDPGAKRLLERNSRRFTPVPDDVDGDGMADATTLGKLTFANGGAVGLVSFSFLAPAPAGAAGGVYAFDTTDGALLGRIIMPLTSTVTGALEFVGSVRATSDRVVVISAQKGPAFEDLGGRVAVYRVRSWSPFAVTDADPAVPFDQPESLVETAAPNPVGLAMLGSTAIVLDAPFFKTGVLDLFDVSKVPATRVQSVMLGGLYTMGFSVPGDPRVAPDGSQVLIGSEAGLVQVTLVKQ